jgi:hypothetical protein
MIALCMLLVCAATASPAQLLDRAQRLYDAGDYSDITAVTDALKLRRGELTREQKLRLFWLSASAIAIVENPLDAQPDLGRLLDLDPDYALPANTPAKIADIFKKVQNERREQRLQAERAQRQRVVSGLKLLDLPSGEAKGGKALAYALRVVDPGTNVIAVHVFYRRESAAGFSSLALARDDVGTWRGVLTGDLTASKAAYTLEYYVETSDSKGPLLVQGTDHTPLQIAVSAGDVASRRPWPRWPFVTSLVATLGAGVAAGAFGLVLWDTQQRRDNVGTTIGGLDAIALQNRGNTAALGVNIALTTTAVLAAFTIVAFVLTDWER